MIPRVREYRLPTTDYNYIRFKDEVCTNGMGAIHPICIIIDENESSVGTNLAALSLSSLMVFSGQKKNLAGESAHIYISARNICFFLILCLFKRNNSCIYLSSKLA